MSQRGKRQPNRSDDGPVVTKRRKCRTSPAEEETASLAPDGSGSWTPRPLTDLKMPSIYNRTTTEAPAELFRKDLISAMKLPDSEPLALDEYWVISDQWKQEWERGVQVPVNPDSLPEPTVTVNHCAKTDKAKEFKLPKSKYIRITKDENFTSENHFLSTTPAKAEKACSYDLDDTDVAWLRILNGERSSMGLPPVTDDQLERVIEELEVRCWEKVQSKVKTEEGLGIEYDENVICDVCRSPDSEEGNEMVFCDFCNICVHQACYGITAIPSGSWLCRTCALGQRPECVLCPNKGGAMKCTRSGQKWAHVSCALWIPEVSIGCVERMEPITKISSIPQSRWALICVLCRERVGACIQCSVKTCKTAYHVTCAFRHGLEMRAIIEDENADDGVKLRSYCQKHSVTSKKDKCGSQSEEEESKRRKRKDMTSEEKNQARAAKLQEIEAEFDKHVSVKDVTQPIDVDPEGIQHIYNYWKLKRKAGFNRPLLPPKSEDVDMLSHQQEQADIEKMKMFVQLRQDLERVRNLCYMVSRREKLSRTFFRMREQTFHKQAAVLSSNNLKAKEVAAVIAANHGPSIYDRLYSQPSSEDHSKHLELVLARIAGTASPPPCTDDKAINGIVKRKDNPYRRLYYLNGATKRRSSLYSTDGDTDVRRTPTKKRLGLPDSASSSQDDEPREVKRRDKSVSVAVKKRSRKSVVSRTTVDSTSDEDRPSRSRTLRRMEREIGSASDDSDELLPIKVNKNEPHKIAAIYSDSDSEVSPKSEEDRNEDKSSTPSDSHPFLRTKAAMKEFSGLQAKSSKKIDSKMSRNVKKSREHEIHHDDSMDDESTKDKENVKLSKKQDYVPTDLFVPQRQAAKKATENLRCSQGRSKEQILFDQDLKTSPPPTPVSEDLKVKQKSRPKYKELKEPRTPGKSNDIYDFEKEQTSNEEAAEILAYVPQRQAAKKAAAHIKSGMTKPATGELDVSKEVLEGGKSQAKKEVDVAKTSKRDSDGLKQSKSPDSKGKPLPKSREILSSSNSSSSSGDSSSSSDSDSDAKTKPLGREKLEKKALPVVPQKDSAKKSKQDWPFLDKGDQSARSSSTSSESSADSDMFTRKKETKPKSKSPKGSPSKLASKKSKKAPDKKLKTSDRRPELKFQPPVTERSEPSRSKETPRKPDVHKKARADSSDRLRDADSGSRAVAGARVRGHSPLRREEEQPSRASRVAQQPKRSGTREPDAERGGDQRARPKNEGRPRKPGDGEGGHRPAGEVSSVARKPSGHQSPAAKKTDKKVDLFESKRDKKLPDKKLEIDKSPEKLSPSKKSSKSPDKLFDKQDSRNEHLLSKRNSSQGSLSPAKAMKPESTSKHKQSSTNISHRKASPVREISARRAKGIDLFEDEDFRIKGKSLPPKQDADISSKPSKYNSILTPNSLRTKDSPLHRSKDHEEEISSPKRDHKTPASIPNDQVHSAPNDKRRESTDSIASASTEYDGDKSRKAKAMPMCKKKALGMLGDEAVVISVSSPVRSARLPSESADQPPSLDLEHDFLAPDDRITSRASSIQRSIFSPQQPKDPVGTELFDFENDILAVDETEELMRPLTFSFSSDCLFKEETKEDSERETLNLVEKLRLQYAQKTTGQPDGSATPSVVDEEPEEKPEEEPVKEEVPPEPVIIAEEIKVPEPEMTKAEEPPPETYDYRSALPAVEVVKASIPSLEKLDRSNIAQADERWVPPSAEYPQQQPYPAQSPYTDHRARAKWNDSEVLPSRRSSSSSASSSSSSSHREEVEAMKPDYMFSHNPADLYQAMHPAFDVHGYHPYSEASQFVNSVPMFHPALPQLPFPSQGTGIYSPTFNPPCSMPQVTKPPEEHHMAPPCAAAFTSSSHNMALIAELVAQPPPPSPVLHPDPPLTPARYSAPDLSPVMNHSVGKESPPKPGKKSPSKPTRTSARVTSQLSKSPRQDVARSPARVRGRRGNGRRGRGRARCDPGTTVSKLAGTVYDLEFDDDDSGVESMRAMRERRKSSEVHSVLPSPPSPPPPTPAPLLPGPVDMRTYNYEPPEPAPTFNNLLPYTADQHVADLEQDLEQALLAVPVQPDEKVSLTDSRNQLKVKIKGPFLDANYSTASLAQPPAPQPPLDFNPPVVPFAAPASGISSLRRMRKKELLRQYCSQDMNMPDSVAPATPAAPPVSRTGITIPKAVASMTTIPTREDYKAVVDANMEKKRRKEVGVRDLEDPGAPERRRSVGSTGSASSLIDSANKRRGRPPKPTECPVLKIKIKSEVPTEEKLKIKPPKKRLSKSIPPPTMEEMKKESMKFRRIIMADLDKEKEKKKRKESKLERKKSKEQRAESKKHRHEVQIVEMEETSTSTPKLIIRINKQRPGADGAEPTDETTSANTPTVPATDKDPSDETIPSTDPSTLLKVRTSKVSPIRLKLARCNEGYMMKTQASAVVDPLATEVPPEPVNNNSAVLVNAGCEVR